MTLPDAGFSIAAAIPLIALLAVYGASGWRRRAAGRPVSAWRHAAFAGGALLFLMSMEGSFARIAHELFTVHQLGILIARIAAPLLIALSHPGGLLVAGLPRPARARVLARTLGSPATRATWRVLRAPWLVLLLYVGSLYLWETPVMQALALAIPVAGLAMHFSLFLAALLFWSTILERRPAPHGAAHGERLMMIWVAMLAQILLGAYLTVKTSILYPAYAAGERLMHVSPIIDEQGGGVLVWIPSALLLLLALLMVVHALGRHETLLDDKRKRWTPSNSAILLYPTTAAALIEMAAPKNRRMRFGMVGFVAMLFATMVGIAVTGHQVNRDANLRLYRESRR